MNGELSAYVYILMEGRDLQHLGKLFSRDLGYEFRKWILRLSSDTVLEINSCVYLVHNQVAPMTNYATNSTVH